MPLFPSGGRYAAAVFPLHANNANANDKMRHQHGFNTWDTLNALPPRAVDRGYFLHSRPSVSPNESRYGGDPGGRGGVREPDRQAFARFPQDSGATQSLYGHGYHDCQQDNAYSRAVHPTELTSQGFYQQPFYGGQAQYAAIPFPSFPMHAHNPYRPQPWLTRQWQADKLALGPQSDPLPQYAQAQPRDLSKPLVDELFQPFLPQQVTAERYESTGIPALAAQARKAHRRKKPPQHKFQVSDVAIQPAFDASVSPSATPPSVRNTQWYDNKGWSAPIAHTYEQAIEAPKVVKQERSEAPQAAIQASFDLPLRLPQSSQASHQELLKRPEPTWAYMKQAKQDPRTLEKPRRLLVVVDLNGTLLYRHHRRGSRFVPRPRVQKFLHYLLTNHEVMIWSSARPENVNLMVDKLFGPSQRQQLTAIWARDKLGLTSTQYNEKVQVYKHLSWIWKDQIVQASAPGGDDEWCQENTVLVDDSTEKAASEPFNIIKIDEFEARPEQMKVDVLGQVVDYLEELRKQQDVSAYMRSKPFIYDREV